MLPAGCPGSASRLRRGTVTPAVSSHGFLCPGHRAVAPVGGVVAARAGHRAPRRSLCLRPRCLFLLSQARRCFLGQGWFRAVRRERSCWWGSLSPSLPSASTRVLQHPPSGPPPSSLWPQMPSGSPRHGAAGEPWAAGGYKTALTVRKRQLIPSYFCSLHACAPQLEVIRHLFHVHRLSAGLVSRCGGKTRERVGTTSAI